MSRFSLIINSLSSVIVTWGLINSTSAILPPNLAIAGQKQFLTNIGASLTVIKNVLSILNEFIGGNGTALGYFSSEVAFPTALVLESIISCVYWPLRLFFIQLIYHSTTDGKPPFPVSVDIAIHLVPVLGLLLEYFLAKPEPFRLGLSQVSVILLSLGFGYRYWLHSIVETSKGQTYPYPFIAVPEPWVSLIFCFITLWGWGFYWIYKRTHRGAVLLKDTRKKD